MYGRGACARALCALMRAGFVAVALLTKYNIKQYNIIMYAMYAQERVRGGFVAVVAEGR